MEKPNSARIIVWGINYAPEETGIAPYNTDLCRYLHERGCGVGMVTSFPYYPQWRKRPGDRYRLYRKDHDGGVVVHRCALYVPANPTAARRMLHEASFVLTSFVRLLVLPAPDAYVVISPPLALGAAARLLSFLKRKPYHFHVQDMQPDAAIEMGFLREGPLTRFLYRLETVAYRGARQVSGITEGMLRLFRRKGVPNARIRLFPNWRIHPQGPATNGTDEGAFRARHGIADDTLLLVYSGNLGRKQGLGILLDAAARLKADSAAVRLIIAGDGGEKEALARRIASENLPNVTLLPLLPLAEYRAMLADADACLVTQQKGSGALFFPSKLLNILAAGKPVLAVADMESELHRAVAEGGFGRAVPPESPDELTAAVRELAADRSTLIDMGTRAPRWVERFGRDTVLDAFFQELTGIGSPASPGRRSVSKFC